MAVQWFVSLLVLYWWYNLIIIVYIRQVNCDGYPIHTLILAVLHMVLTILQYT